MSPLRFEHPEALVLIPLAAAAFWLWRRRLGGPLTLAALTCLALAMARPQWASQVRRVARIYALDTSGSTFLDTQAALQAVGRSIRELRADDRAALLAFGGGATVVLPPTPPPLVPEQLGLPPDLPRPDATDIAAALRLAAQQLGDKSCDRQVVVLTDGRETTGEASLEAALAADNGLRIFALPVGPANVVDARVAGFRAPARVRQDEAFEIETELAATAPVEASLVLTRDGSPLKEFRGLALQPGPPRRIVVADRLSQGGAHTYSARLSVPDRCAENNLAQAIVLVEGPTRVLHLTAGNPTLAQALQAGGTLAIEQVEPRNAHELAARLAGGDCLIVDGVPAAQIDPPTQRAIRDWVRDAGGGLIALGGPASYGPGGYAGTPIEEALPVLCSRPRKIALVVALDRSGSMGERMTEHAKIVYAREAVVFAASQLPQSDSFGLVAFAGEPEVVFPLGPIPPAERLEARLKAIEPHGPTELQAALERALELIGGAAAQVRHVILVSDGQTTRLDTAALKQRYARAGVTLSVLMTGADPKAIALLQELTGASFHLVKAPPDLRARFLQELRNVTYGRAIQEGEAAVRLAGPADITRGIGSPGPLQAYVRTVGKATAAVEWVTGDPADPILARWQFGLGRAVAFTPTVGTRWDERFWRGDALGRLWPQAVAWAARPPRTPGFEADMADRGDEMLLTVRAEREGRFLNGLRLAAHIATPESKPLNVELRQTAPGQYEAAFAAPLRGGYHVTVIESGQGQRLSVAAVKNYAREWEAFGVDRPALEAIARNGGGKVLSGLDDLRGVTSRRAMGQTDVGWLAITTALVLFVAEVALGVLRSKRARM